MYVDFCEGAVFAFVVPCVKCEEHICVCSLSGSSVDVHVQCGFVADGFFVRHVRVAHGFISFCWGLLARFCILFRMCLARHSLRLLRWSLILLM